MSAFTSLHSGEVVGEKYANRYAKKETMETNGACDSRRFFIDGVYVGERQGTDFYAGGKSVRLGENVFVYHVLC